MKKTVVLILTVTLLLTFATSAMAVTVKGPNVVFTAATGTKTSNGGSPYLNVLVFSTSGDGYFVCWITNNALGKQVTPTYYLYNQGAKTLYYLQDASDEEVKAGASFSARFRTNPGLAENAESTIHVAFYP